MVTFKYSNVKGDNRKGVRLVVESALDQGLALLALDETKHWGRKSTFVLSGSCADVAAFDIGMMLGGFTLPVPELVEHNCDSH